MNGTNLNRCHRNIVVSSGQFTQLSLKGSKLVYSKDITDEELSLVSSHSLTTIQKMAEEEKTELLASFRKVTGILFDTGVNDHGFAMSAKAFKHMISHFKRTIDTPYLHNFFRDHEFMSVDAMLGRQVKLTFNQKSEQVLYEALLSNKHPLVQRAELMKSVSGTIVRGTLECNNCGDPYTNGWFPEPTCDHIPNGSDTFPVTHKAIHIETSFVTFPAYRKTSVEVSNAMQEKYANSSSFSGVLKEEFPDDPAADKKTEVLAQLQTEGLDTSPNEETEQEKANKEVEQATFAEMMTAMSNLSELLKIAMEGFTSVS